MPQVSVVLEIYLPGNDGPNSDRGVFDSWSLTHISHGVIAFFILMGIRYLINTNFKKNIPVTVLFLMTFIGETLWEYIENLESFITKLQKGGMTIDGDSIVNSIGDIISCLTGFLITSISPIFGLFYVIISEFILYPRSLIGLLIEIN